MSYSCQAIVISCMDFRLHNALHLRTDEKFGCHGYDLVHVAGGGGAILSQDSMELVLKQIGLSVKLHGVKEVVLVNHEDCGAYGGKKMFANDQEERRKHRDDLEAAAAIVSARYPTLAVTTVFQRIDGTPIIL